MVNHSDNSDKKSTSAEALYAHYQRNRQVDTQTHKSKAGLNLSENALLENDNELAENLYKHYQATRTTNAQASVDAIMRKIGEQSLEQVISQEEQPLLSQDTPQIHTINAQPVQVDKQSQIDVPAANSSSVFKRWMLPGVAAAILGIALIPMLLNNSAPNPEPLQVTLPTELSDSATQTVAYIDVPESTAFGFANTTNAAQFAFNNGVITTDLALLVEAEQTVKTQQFLRALVATQNSAQQQGAMSDSVKELSGQLLSSAVSMSDAIGAGESKAVLQEHLTTIYTALEKMAAETEQKDWFVAGQTVESIRVAAELALEHSDTKPLAQALNMANKMTHPTSEAPASELLPQLLQADLSGPEEFEKASELLTVANDIKLLMQ